ncbi:hypothetical protein Tco_1428539 [Tanacetum coccineum]
MAYSLEVIDSSKLVVTKNTVNYVLAKYENKWEVDDPTVDEILDDLLQRTFIEPKLVKNDKRKRNGIVKDDKGNGKRTLNDDKGKLLGIKCVDDLEKRLQNVEAVLYKAKEQMIKQKEVIIISDDDTSLDIPIFSDSDSSNDSHDHMSEDYSEALMTFLAGRGLQRQFLK